VPWVEVFAVFVISHLVGDFLLQTNWQATHKTGGLSHDPESRRALISHTVTYTLAFVPALIWLATDIGVGWAIGVGALVAIPHMLQDDGRALGGYMREVKGVGDDAPAGLRLAVDQTGHFITLFLLALLAGS
jgi:Protein of unknown function (DUF3307)